LPDSIVVNQAPVRVDWNAHEGDTNELTFRVRDDNDAVITDLSGWEFTAVVVAERGGDVLGECDVDVSGAWVTLTRPDVDPGLHWWEFQYTDPDGKVVTPMAGPIHVGVDSIVEESS
jgi:hypothetical protein